MNKNVLLKARNKQATLFLQLKYEISQIKNYVSLLRKTPHNGLLLQLNYSWQLLESERWQKKTTTRVQLVVQIDNRLFCIYKKKVIIRIKDDHHFLDEILHVHSVYSDKK